MTPLQLSILLLGSLLVGGILLRGTLRRGRARERLGEGPEWIDDTSNEPERSGTGAWLSRSGLRHPSALSNFVWAQVGATLLGLAAAAGLFLAPALQLGREAMLGIPGGAGRLLEPVLLVAPVLVFVIVALTPILWVRRKRALRLLRIEQDLPLVLELMASLAQSGLGFDGSLARLIETQDPARPLIADLQAFRRDIMAGLPRSECFERLGERAAAPGVDVLVAALIHSEQLGASIASTLRTQADEAWNDRKERMLARSQSLPTRLAAPLVVCFLPGLLVVTLAPALVRFTELVSGVLDGNN